MSELSYAHHHAHGGLTLHEVHAYAVALLGLIIVPIQIRKMQGRKQIIVPHALDGEIPSAPEPTQPARILKLTTLAPDIIQAILNGEEPDGVSLAKLTQSFPEEWAEQRKLFKVFRL